MCREHMKVLLYTVFKDLATVLFVENKVALGNGRSLKTEQCRRNAMLRASSHTIEMTVRLLGSTHCRIVVLRLRA